VNRAADKPPRVARDGSDLEWMERRLNAELDRILDAGHAKLASEATAWITAMGCDVLFRKEQRQRLNEVRWQVRKSDAAVIEAARHGDLEPARKKYPELAEADMLKLPDQPRGKTFPKLRGRTPHEVDLTEAVWDAAKIRAIWKREYPRRPRDYDSPEAMAARRWGVDEDDVRSWAKNRRCTPIPDSELPH
jgi:hypothetical protein